MKIKDAVCILGIAGTMALNSLLVWLSYNIGHDDGFDEGVFMSEKKQELSKIIEDYNSIKELSD